MDRNHKDYKDAMRIGAYLIECSFQNVTPIVMGTASQFMTVYTTITARALQTNVAQLSVDIKDEWNKQYDGKRAIK